jgi:hypothetical protein
MKLPLLPLELLKKKDKLTLLQLLLPLELIMKPD